MTPPVDEAAGRGEAAIQQCLLDIRLFVFKEFRG
jgi:hypothetical protein